MKKQNKFLEVGDMLLVTRTTVDDSWNGKILRILAVYPKDQSLQYLVSLLENGPSRYAEGIPVTGLIKVLM